MSVCPRCAGKIMISEDLEYGFVTLVCLNCGREHRHVQPDGHGPGSIMKRLRDEALERARCYGGTDA